MWRRLLRGGSKTAVELPTAANDQAADKERRITPDTHDRYVDGGGLPTPPTPLPPHRNDAHRFKTFGGPLFAGRIEARDVEQGAIADCFVAAALAATAELRPEAIRAAVESKGEDEDGHRLFDITLFEANGEAKAWPVDDRLLVGPSGRPVYGRWPSEREQELWFPLLEKAIIDRLDAEDGVPGDEGYEAGDAGGSAFVVFEALLGAAPQNYRLAQHQDNPQGILQLIDGALAAREPVVAYTYGRDHADLYADNGLTPWHTYAVLGVDAAKETVRLYNPWSEGEFGRDGKDDGFFDMKVQDFLRLFRNMNIAHDPQVG